MPKVLAAVGCGTPKSALTAIESTFTGGRPIRGATSHLFELVLFTFVSMPGISRESHLFFMRQVFLKITWVQHEAA
jgi:hypothetical protein